MATKLTLSEHAKNGTVAVLALLTVWRLHSVLPIAGSQAILHSAVSVLLFAALWLLYARAFACRDRRVNITSYAVGFVFSLFLTLGAPLERDGAYAQLTASSVLGGLLTLITFTFAMGALVALVCQAYLLYTQREPKSAAPSRLSYILGNYWVALLLLLLCWLPVWLAFWPGTFRYDAPTQFSMYIDSMLTTHHPLLHTLLLGWCMDIGLAQDSAAMGVAVYSGIQLVALACMLAYACHWLYKRGVPVVVRVIITLLFMLLPLYPLWSFSATKDVLFGGFTLVSVLLLADIWQAESEGRKAIWRYVLLSVFAALMMLFRNNGVYAFCVCIPVFILQAKHKRIRTAIACVAAVLLYLLCNWGLVSATEAESGSTVEMLSIPLQQIARVATKAPEALTDDDYALLNDLYPETAITAAYDPTFADPVKWAVDYDMLDERLAELLSLWARLGAENPGIYAEAFLVQNLPYYLPGAGMRYHVVLGVDELDYYPIEADSQLPWLRSFYTAYDRTLQVFDLPGTQLLSSTAAMVWLTLLCLALGIAAKQRGIAMGCVLLLTVWLTCLLGPVAVMRYLLCLHYGAPVLAAALFAPKRNA